MPLTQCSPSRLKDQRTCIGWTDEETDDSWLECVLDDDPGKAPLPLLERMNKGTRDKAC